MIKIIVIIVLIIVLYYLYKSYAKYNGGTRKKKDLKPHTTTQQNQIQKYIKIIKTSKFNDEIQNKLDNIKNDGFKHQFVLDICNNYTDYKNIFNSYTIALFEEVITNLDIITILQIIGTRFKNPTSLTAIPQYINLFHDILLICVCGTGEISSKLFNYPEQAFYLLLGIYIKHLETLISVDEQIKIINKSNIKHILKINE